jgi:hypothetical protein
VWTSSQNRIQEWDPQGNLVQSWDARGPNGNWSTIHGMFVDHNDFLWTNARESNLTGEIQQGWPGPDDHRPVQRDGRKQ